MTKRISPLLIGNWKATPQTKEEAIAFIKTLERKIKNSKVKLPKKSYYVAVPEIFIPLLAPLAKHGVIGAQHIPGIQEGQETGATTATQLFSGGASFTIIGHSEVRRRGETVDTIRTKVERTLTLNKTAVLCIGEAKRDKEGLYLQLLEQEIRDILSSVKREYLKNLIIAYEPIWAIGGTQPATAHECFEVVIAVRRALASLAGIDYAKKVHILYGGTVTKNTVTSFLTEGGVNGLLIGRSSQEVTSFFEIITLAYEQ